MLADRIHTLAQQRLRATTGQAVAGMLAAVTLERSDGLRDAYAAATARTVSGGQRAAARLAVAYIAAYAPPAEPPNLARALDGLLITPESDGAIVGLLRLWSLLDDGVEELEARAEAGQLAGGFAQQNVRSAMSAGLDEAPAPATASRGGGSSRTRGRASGAGFSPA